MPSKPTTRWQVSGYRFLVRRMEHALVRRDVRMLHDPMKSQSRAYAVGLVLALVVLAGCGVLALLRPQDKVGSNTLLIGKESGQVYVVLGDTVHPALNLASARLALGEPGKVVIVKEAEVAKKPRGQLIGIPGAPSALNFDAKGSGHAWTVCDQLTMDGSKSVTSTVIAGDPVLEEKTAALPAGRALLVQGSDSAYLVYDNQRARVDMADRAVTDALGIRGATPQPISDGLLNAIPEVPPLIPPSIADLGGSPAKPVEEHRIGDVVYVASESQNYVVLRAGLQAISPLTAEIIRNSNPAARTADISSYVRTQADITGELAVQHYPAAAPVIVEVKDHAVRCLSWRPLPTSSTADADGTRTAELTLLTGRMLPIPDSARPVQLAQADAQPGKVAQFYTRPGSGMLIQPTGIETDSQRRDAALYLADTGVRYGITDADAQKALGMDSGTATPERAPWAIVGLLPGGPALGREEALVAHDGVAPDNAPDKQLVQSAK
ncbi:type VII secretion protein EccB [Nocardia jiangsuensis]|uniref:Type VII secretion protein EccB n=1 Tax=Nocardia jiangsuensis TaxID=1691563 RepID=A0ABV8DVD1_9NOCA